MAIILKQVFPLVLAALILAVSPDAVNAANKGIRGSKNKNQQLDSIAISASTISENNNLSDRQLKKDTTNNKGKKDEKKDEKKTKESSSSSSSTNNGNSLTGSGTMDSRFDIPADTTPAPVPTGPSLTNWIQGCLTENRDVNSCSPVTSYVCKNCLYALSITSTTPNSGGGVAACARDNYCGDCTSNDLMPFFACGWEISNPNAATDAAAVADAADDNFPASSIRTPPPTNAAAATTPPAIDDSLYDLINCPSLYPESGTNCTMIEGFEYKKCMYYELGTDVMCQCSKDQPIWSCTGTMVSEEIVVETEDLTVTLEEEIEVDMVSSNNITQIEALPSVEVVFSRTEGSDETGSGEYPVSLLCPVGNPETGDRCSTGSFQEILCCYEDPEPSPNTLGTITCTCSGDLRTGFNCNAGSLSTCTITP